MKKIILILLSFCLTISLFSQGTSAEYNRLTKEANQQRIDENYKSATELYTKAFAANNDKAKVYDRYMLATCWTKLNNIDSAFFQLERIAFVGKFSHYDLIEGDVNLIPLRTDKRWKVIIDKMKQNYKE